MAHGAVETWSVAVMHTVTIVIVMLWILSMAKENNLIFYRTPLDLPVMLLLLITVISTSFSVYPYASRIHAYKIINYVLIFFFLINTTKNKRDIINLVRTIVVFGGVYAIAALAFVKGNLLGFKIFSLEQNFIALTFVNHNHFAGFLEMVIWLCLGLVLSYKGIKHIILICLGMCIAVAILFSLSRGGTIGLLGGLLFFIIITAFCRGGKKSITIFLIFSAVVLLAVTLLGGFDPVFERMSTLKAPTISGESRLGVWKDTLIMIKENPWFGRGIGTFKYVYSRYQTESIMFSFNHAHNSYLELTSEIGIIGILSCILIIAILFIGGIKRLIAQHDKQLQAIGIGSLAGCFSVLIHEITDFNFYIPSNAFLFAVCAAISLISTQIHINKPFHLMHIQLLDRRNGLFYFVILLLSILSIAGVLSPFIGNMHHKEAEEQMMLKNYDVAYNALKSAIFVDAGNAEHIASMGDLMVKNAAATGDEAKKRIFYSNAITYYDDAIAACPVRGYYYTKKAFSLMKLDKSKEAEEAFNKAVYLSPMDASNYFNIGTFYLGQGDTDKAYQEYKKALRFDENYLEPILDMIWEVSPYYDSLSQSVPETAELRKSFANYLFKKELYNAGNKELSFASSLEPTEEKLAASLAQKLGKSYLNRNDIEMAKIYEKAGIYDKAISIYNQLITKYRYNQQSSGFFQRFFHDESDAQLLYTALANLYSKMGRYQEAINILQEGLKKWPNDKRVQRDMNIEIATNYTKQAQYDKAVPIYRQLINAENRPRADFYLTLAAIYSRTSQYQEAINTLQKGIKIWPDNKQLNWVLKVEMAANYNRMNQYDKAIPLYRQLIDEENRPRADFYLTLAAMYSRTSQYQEAINTLQEGVKKWPDDISLHRQMLEYRKMKLN
ncbi:MAG: tetratricopeptide repeat protein [Nitrospirae bacterium]|nr:tetratricopeptide repeat protein [Nitrospirota bacterium]